MSPMPGPTRNSRNGMQARVQRALERCLDWSQQGRHRKVLAEVERLLKLVAPDPQLSAELLIWKAQALLAMGYPQRALPAASASWQLASSPHACHLLAIALDAVGESDRAEELLVMGSELFPHAVHLPVQLAMILADQSRMPEALDVLDTVPPSLPLPDDLQVFLVGLRANLLATVGRWPEAEAAIEEGLGRHPGSSLLLEARSAISGEWNRRLAEASLVASWRAALERLDGVPAEVDDAIVRFGMGLELGELVVLAAQRLWRALCDRDPIRLQSPEPWAAALLIAVMELDGSRPSAAAVGRATSCSESTLRSALRRVRQYLEGLDPSFARRAFGAASNPRLDEAAPRRASQRDTVVRFPG
jgi:tetratricopeptide (TPR) repeat protein